MVSAPLTPLLFILLAQTPTQDLDRAASLLAPSPVDFDRLLGETTSLYEQAEATGVALGRLQNALAERWSVAKTSTVAKGAAPPEPLAMLALAPVLLRDHRDALQSLRAATERLERMTEAPTVAPVVFGNRALKVKRLVEQTRSMVRAYSEMTVWHARFVRPRLARLKEPPELQPMRGFSSAAPSASDDPSARTAIVGVGGGLICPEGHRANGHTVVLRTPFACYAEAECRCVAAPVAPGAVLGP